MVLSMFACIFIIASSLPSTTPSTPSASTPSASAKVAATSAAPEDAVAATGRRGRRGTARLADHHLLSLLQPRNHFGIGAVCQTGKDHLGRQLAILHHR